MPGCAARFEASSEEELLGQVAGHSRADHGITEIPADVLSQVRANITAA